MAAKHPVERGLEQARRRAWRYWYEDGISEMVIGAYFLGLGLVSWVADRVAATGGWAAGLAIVLWPLYVIGGIFLGRWLIRRGKETVTYARSGYARFPRADGPGLPGWGVIALLAAVIMLLIVSPFTWASPALQSLIFLGVMGYLAVTTRQGRFYVLAVLGGLLPWLVFLAHLSSSLQDALIYGGMGLLLLLSGLWQVLHFVRRPPLDTGEGSHA